MCFSISNRRFRNGIPRRKKHEHAIECFALVRLPLILPEEDAQKRIYKPDPQNLHIILTMSNLEMFRRMIVGRTITFMIVLVRLAWERKYQII